MIHKRKVNNQLEARESKDDKDSTLEDPNQAEEDRKEEDDEIVAILNVAPSEE